MQIYGSLPSSMDRPAAAGSGATYASANHVTSDETKHAGGDVQAARDAALSALRNDRFGMMLSKISEPAASGALVTMARDDGNAAADFKTVLSSYAENGE